MWDSWFGGFTEPSDYANAVMPDVNIRAIIISSIFVIPYLAFLIILPGVREKRVVTLVIFTITALVGAVLAASLYLPGWTGGSAKIVSQLRSHVNERMRARVGVSVGLTTINITLRYEQMVKEDSLSRIDMSQLYYNEKFDISGVSSMAEELRSAYQRGLPYPILSILEYFSLNQDAFDWGRHYRTAGHYTSAAVSLALGCWSLAVVFLLLLPHFYNRAMLATGLSALLACLLYLVMAPCQLEIGFVGTEGKRIVMKMSFQWSFYCVFAVGLLAVVVGIFLMLLQHYRVYTLSTFLEARLDETVAKSKPRRNDAVLRRNKALVLGSVSSEKKAVSSGFQSRTSYTGSLRSQSSIESVHGELRINRTPSNLTIDEMNQPRSSRDAGVSMVVERF
ncbi:hypothetical protein ANCCAN_10106 [Ancylostoma caninum]|uniref:DUOXA-like protein C06E1.3 n=1 Tax=Ancylostoma caninum TaxID=29170 RepID=A0A368GLQ0_ANCCA|nr:hypothetical protein ANCCAN_10106 [Ancylostoma caninum]